MKSFFLVSMISVVFAFNYCYSLAPLSTILKNSRSEELGKRYIKLGLSWIVAGDLEKAENYLTYGIRIVKITGNKYWTAVGYEYAGYLNLAKNDKDIALDYFNMAQKLYNKYGTLENGEGSNVSLASIISSLENGDASIFEGGNQPTAKPTGARTSSTTPKNTNDGTNSSMQQILKSLVSKMDQLANDNEDIRNKLDNLSRTVGSNANPTNPRFAIPGIPE